MQARQRIANLKRQDPNAHKNSDLESRILETSYKMAGGRNYSSAEASFADRKHQQSYVEQLKIALGDKWSYSQHMGIDRNPNFDPYYDPEAGEMVFPSSKGDVRFLNHDYIMKMKQIEEFIEDKVDYMMKFCVISDELCQDALDLDVTAYDALLQPVGGGKNGSAKQQTDLNMDDEMQKLDARIISIKSTPAGSILQTQKLSKLRVVARALRHRFVVKDINRHIEDAKKLASNEVSFETSKAIRAGNPNEGIPGLKAPPPAPAPV